MARSTLITLLALKAVAIALALCHQWLAVAVVWFAPDLWVLYHLFVPSAQGLCRNFTRFETSRQEIWLTIDDGPDATDTPAILDLLDRHQARATFFVIGARAALHPELLAEIARRGHEVGHHTQTHPAATFWCASRARLYAELDGVFDAVRPSGAKLRWFRPPVGIKHFLLPAALAARGLSYVGWSVRSGDYFARQPETVTATVMRRLRPGAIVLLHEGPTVHATVRVKAIGHLLEALDRQNYRCILPDPATLR
jgi:peptidoglycan/xylan/chitin deacetylase (PgdA/CDA1 family)